MESDAALVEGERALEGLAAGLELGDGRCSAARVSSNESVSIGVSARSVVSVTAWVILGFGAVQGSSQPRRDHALSEPYGEPEHGERQQDERDTGTEHPDELPEVHHGR